MELWPQKQSNFDPKLWNIKLEFGQVAVVIKGGHILPTASAIALR